MTEFFPRWTEIAETRGLRLLGIVLTALVLNRLLKMASRRLVQLAKSQSRVALVRELQTRTMAGFLYSVGTTAIFVVAVLAALPEFGFNVTPLAAAAGLASLALGFGAQHLVRDLINGFFIVFEDQYGVGDTIRVGDVVGRVEHLTLRRTLLRSDRGAMVTIPNGSIAQVANLSRDWSQTYVDVNVASDESVARALALLEKIAADFRADPDWTAALVDGPRVLGVECLSLSGTTLRILVRCAPTRQDDVARELRRRIKAGFEQANIVLSSTQKVELVGGNKKSE